MSPTQFATQRVANWLFVKVNIKHPSIHIINDFLNWANTKTKNY